MSAKKRKVTASVRVVLDIDVSDVWGADCTLHQVQKQSKDSARNILRKLPGMDSRIQVVEDLKSTVIVIEED